MEATELNLTDAQRQSARGAGIKHRGKQGSWHNPVSLSRVSPDRVLDTRTVLRADDLKLVVAGRNCRTTTLRALANDKHLSLVVADRAEAAAIIACDQHASGQRDWLPNIPAYSEQLGADGRLAGVDAPKVADGIEWIDTTGAAYGMHVRCVVSAVVEVRQPASGDAETDLRLRHGLLDDDAGRARRLAHLADCILAAIAECGLLTIEP